MTNFMYITGHSQILSGSVQWGFQLSRCDPFLQLNKTVNMKSQEIWKYISGYNNLYTISENGTINSLHGRKGKIYTIPHRINHAGYSVVTLSYNGRRQKYRVSRLVALTFIPNPDNKRFVNHKDGDKLNNHIDNLEWCTHSENIRHAHENGLIVCAKGEKHGMAKLTEQDVRHIKYMISCNNKLTDIAKEYNVALSTVSHIKTGRLWRHVE